MLFLRRKPGKAVFQGQYGNDYRGGGRKMDGFGEP